MKLTEPEWQLMNALWKKSPATAREIIEHIPGNVKWAYTTVKTMLSRLVAKKAVSEKKNSNTSIYEPLISQENAQRSAMSTLFDKVLDGAFEPLMHFLVNHKKISAKERQELIRLLEESEK
ncbi:MAG: BlaI/MecI/CopY family transcriptional regulator [Calditrichaeota bacterium]|nr:MAG: BlaI/MecI/CopY family transcriptional regulator [Calditrichota bacterium]MBL1207503.1 BlaI/MecI/CopY family transcriptional regulator [Calditrichota bacterium]NOG47335.1 BlaI/MecI/CopY family transcriptional regulator [Calditrichota bacterium]